MIQFFIMIFDIFIWFANLGTRMFAWFSSLAKYAMFSTAIRIFLYSLFYAFLLMFITASGFFFYYMVTNIIKIYNLISFALDYISYASTSGDSIVSTTFFFLTVSGIVDGVKAFFPFFASAVLFLLMKSLYKITMFFYIQVMRTIGIIVNVL